MALADRPRDPAVAPMFVAATEIPAEIPGEGFESRQLELAVRLAMLLKRPIGFIDDAHCRIGTLEPAQVRAIATHPAFRGPINRTIAECIGHAATDIESRMLSRLASSPRSRL